MISEKKSDQMRCKKNSAVFIYRKKSVPYVLKKTEFDIVKEKAYVESILRLSERKKIITKFDFFSISLQL